MAVILACPAGHRLKVPSKFMGRRIVCPVCDARIDVPGLDGELPSSAAGDTRIQDWGTQKRSGTRAKDSVYPPQPPTDKATQPRQATPPKESQISNVSFDDGMRGERSEDRPGNTRPNPGISAEESREAAELASKAASKAASSDTPMEFVSLEPTMGTQEPWLDLNAPSESEATADAWASPEYAIYEWDVPGERVERNQAPRQFVNTLVLSIASIAVAIFCLIPSVVEQSVTRQLDLRSPDVWSYLVILISTIQVGMAIFAMRVPDWSTVWLLTVTATGVGAVYAAGLALTMFASQNHVFVRQLGLLDEAVRNRAQPWCFLVVCLAVMLAYFCGRCSVGWHQSDMQLAANGSGRTFRGS